MPKYHVTVTVTRERVYEVDAESPTQARRLLVEDTPPEPISDNESPAEMTVELAD